MEVAGNTLCIALLGILSWQDFKSRLISAWLIPVIALALLAGDLHVYDAGMIVRNMMVNLVVLFVLLVLLTLWVSLRNKRFVRIADVHIGWGDIIFLACLTPVFSPVNFCVFFTVGSYVALFAWWLIALFRKNASAQIPLAGIFSVLLLVYEAGRMPGLIPAMLANENWINNYLLYPL